MNHYKNHYLTLYWFR